jgi:pyridoxine 4-dehydrogenase
MPFARIRSSQASPPVTAAPAQVALAWLLTIADNVQLIPGTSNRGRLAKNLPLGHLSLQDDEIASLSGAFS